jgi:hypothetical protein
MLKPKVQTYVVCQKADDISFLGQERSVDGGIHTTRDHNNIKCIAKCMK